MFGRYLVTIADQLYLIFGCEVWPEISNIGLENSRIFSSSKRVGTLFSYTVVVFI